MYNDLKGFINHLENPVILCNETGEILKLNDEMKKVLKFVGLENIKNISIIDTKFKECSNRKQIKLRDLNVFVDIYKISGIKGDLQYIYLFEKSIITDNVVEDIIEHIDEIVVIFNKDGIIEKMNSLCDEILPFKRKEVLGNKIDNLVYKGIVEEPIIKNMLQLKKKVYKSVVYPGGKVIAFTAVPIWDDKGKIKGGVLTGRDISRVIELDTLNVKKSVISNNSKYISKSKVMENIKDVVKRAALSDSSIFITGESGVGKEIIARNICKYSRRREKPFIAINCGAIPNELLESEFFGYEEGSFTGAKKSGKKGLFEQANGGTIFLDEIGELPLQMQKKLLRVIQENTITRVGGTKPIKIDVRYVSATNISNEDLHNNLKFRQDLYYRLSVIPIKIPPLRERKEDIKPLVEYFLDLYNTKYSRDVKISQKVMNLLNRHSWPGNIRELKNIIERFVVLSVKNTVGEDEFNMLINLDDLAKENDITSPIVVNGIVKLNEAYKMIDQIIIPRAIDKYGSITKASKQIGIDSSTIHRKIKNGYLKLTK